MNAKVMTLEQIRLTGLEALSRELGAVGLIRFLQQFETGYGDYTKERHAWLDQLDVQTIVEEIWADRQREETSELTAQS